MVWDVEYTDEFGEWWQSLSESEQESMAASAILLIGGDKTGDERWHETYIPIADRLYGAHLEQLRKEG